MTDALIERLRDALNSYDRKTSEQAERIAALEEFLKYLQRLGGLGLDVHARIDALLKETP